MPEIFATLIKLIRSIVCTSSFVELQDFEISINKYENKLSIPILKTWLI